MRNVLSSLPRPIVDYLVAERSKDAAAQSKCFTDDAVVNDEGRDYHGRDEIRAWKEEARAKYQYDLEPLDASINGDIVTVVARLKGNFPGSPVDVDHTFTLENDKIASLVIH
jgi:ketosteroid isomerase-like protein